MNVIEHSRHRVAAQQLVAIDLVLGPLFIGRPPCGHNPAMHSGGLPPLPICSAAPTTVYAREGSDHFPTIARWNGTHRVIECADGVQWIVQRYQGGRWRNISFHLDRDVLIERCGATGNALAILHALPRRHP